MVDTSGTRCVSDVYPITSILTSEGLFKEISRGCNLEVNPSGMTAKFVFFSWKWFLMLTVLCAVKESSTKSDLGLLPYPQRFNQIFSTHHNISLSFIQPLGFARIITPSGNSSQRIFFNLKIITGGNLVPSAKQVNTTVKFNRS